MSNTNVVNFPPSPRRRRGPRDQDTGQTRRRGRPQPIPPVPVVTEAAPPAAPGPTAKASRLKELQAEWNGLVPQAVGRGIKVRVLTSLHESVAKGEARLDWLREQLAKEEH